jgi:hypothetical protein
MKNGIVVDVEGKCNVRVETKKRLKKICDVLFLLDLDQNLINIG